MIEISGVTLLGLFCWVATAIFVYGTFVSQYAETRQMWAVLSIFMGTIALILTLIGTGVLEIV